MWTNHHSKTMNTEKQFPVGIRIDKPREGAPDFVRGRIGVEVDKFIAYLGEHKNDRGWVNFDILSYKEGGNLYLKLNDWKPKVDGEKVDYPERPSGEVPF